MPVPAASTSMPFAALPEMKLRFATPALLRADGRPRSPGADQHAVVLVGHGGRAAGVGADEVAVDGGAGSPAVGHQDAVGAVARDDVILGVGAGARVADGVVDGAQADVDAVEHVGHGDGAGVVGADEVALDDVLGGAEADQDALVRVARDDVAGGRRGPADGVARPPS